MGLGSQLAYVVVFWGRVTLNSVVLRISYVLRHNIYVYNVLTLLLGYLDMYICKPRKWQMGKKYVVVTGLKKYQVVYIAL